MERQKGTGRKSDEWSGTLVSRKTSDCHNLIISGARLGRGARRAAGALQGVGARAARPARAGRDAVRAQATNDPW